MSDFVRMFQEGGASMFAVLGLDMCASFFVPIALIIAIVARARNKMRGVALAFGVLALILSLLPMCAGVGGYFWGMDMVERAVVHADPSSRDALYAAGEAEASNNLSFGFGSGCCCLVPALLALLLVPPKPVVYDDF